VIWAILILPAAAGLASMAIRRHWPRRALLVACAAVHAALVAACWKNPTQTAAEGWLGLDPLGLVFLSIASAIFLCAAVYAAGYLSREPRSRTTDFEEGFLFDNSPEAIFTGCLMLFLASMSLVAVSRHVGLLWAAVEATTLASAPLICFHRHHRSLEATWKYLLICSVGIALAMLGNFFLAVAGSAGGGEGVHLTLESLVKNAPRLDPAWLKAAFILCLVGYGTKMGLAPMHTWLPDAHSESPSLVSALLSGALLNCAFLAILRLYGVMAAAGQAAMGRELLVALGLVSMGLAALFAIQQVDFKRLLAYSSVEHMGMLALGVGAGGVATMGSLLHAVNHSFTKAALFLVAGNILAAWRTKSSADVRGMLRLRPLSGALWLAGFLAITGFPPFGSFISELMILRGILEGGDYVTAGLFLAALGIVFVAMARVVLPMAYGLPAAAKTPSLPAPTGPRESAWSVVPPAVLLTAVLALGVCMPGWLTDALQKAADFKVLP
jgi:hydrogenase-4 component F